MSWRLAAAGGALLALSGVGVAQAAGNAGRYIATNPAGSYLYVSNLLSASIAQYSVGSTGTLTALNPTYVATGTGPIGISIDPNGRFLYDVDYYSNTVSTFSIAAGKLTAVGSALATGSSPICGTLDPTGRFFFAGNSDSQATGTPGPNTSISSFTVDVASGALTVLSTTALANDNIWCMNVDPTGRYAYAVTNMSASGLVYQFKISTSGALTALTPATVTTGSGAGVIAFDPFGRFVYIVNGGANTVSQYAIDATGALQALSPASVSTGAGPTAVTVDIAGLHAYVTNGTDNTISQYNVGTSGALTQLTPPTVGDYAGTFPTSITTTGVIQ